MKGKPMSKVVTSPAGEEIEILSDDQWLQLIDGRTQSLAIFDTKRPVLGALWTHGAYENSSGQATSLVHDDALALGYQGMMVSMLGIINSAAMRPALARDIKGRRTFRIQLAKLPQSWFDKLNAEWPRTNGHATVANVPAVIPPDTPVAETAPIIVHDFNPTPVIDDVPTLDELLHAEPIDYAPPIELTIANAVAQAMITQVVEIISAGTSNESATKLRETQATLRSVEEVLAKRLEENNKLRMSNNRLNERIQATEARINSLTTQLRTSEYNLRQATSQDTQRFINEQVQKELAKIMSAKPNEKA